jgi:hypothetical protein
MVKKKQVEKDKKQQSYYVGVGLALGIPFGALAGIAVFDNLAIGVGLGISVGLCFGVAFSSSVAEK